MKKSLILTLAIAFLAVFPGSGVAQQKAEEKRQPMEMKSPIAPEEGTITQKSPAVSLRTVGKEVAPGGFEVDPSAIRGKRLTIPGGQTLRFICIGKWKAGECKGIYIEW
jgi:hypothetical protein